MADRVEIIIGARDKASQEIKGIKGTVEKFSGSIKKMGTVATVTGTAITGTFALMIRNTIRAGDELHEMALRTGIAGESLAELGHVAALSGGSLADVEQGSKRLSMSIIDASDGLAASVREFERIGVSIEELTKLNPEEQFLRVGEAIARMENDTTRAAAAQALLGRTGTRVISMFADGTQAMKSQREEAIRLGRPTEEMIENADALGDAQEELRRSLVGVSMVIAEQIMPHLIKFTEKLKEVIIRVREWMQKNPELTRTITILTATIGLLSLALGPILLILPGIAIATTVLAGKTKILSGALVALTAKTKILSGALVALKIKLWPIALALAAIAGAGKLGSKAIDKFFERRIREEEMKVELELLAGYAKVIKKRFGEASDELKFFNEQIEKGASANEAFSKMLAKVAEETKRIQEAAGEAAETVAEHWDALISRADTYRLAIEEMRKTETDKKIEELERWFKAEEEYLAERVRQLHLSGKDSIKIEEEYQKARSLLIEKYKTKRADILKDINREEEERLARREQLLKRYREAFGKDLIIPLDVPIETIEKREQALDEVIDKQKKRLETHKEITEEIKRLTKSEADFAIYKIEEVYKVLKADFEGRKEMLDDLAKWKKLKLDEIKEDPTISPDVSLEQARLRTHKEIIEEIKRLTKSEAEFAIYQIEKVYEARKADFEGQKEMLDDLAEWRKLRLDEIEVRYKEHNIIMKELAIHTAKNMQNALGTFFFDAIIGELKTVEDYMRAFGKAMARMLSELLAKQAMLGLFGAKGGLFPAVGRLIGLAGGGRIIQGEVQPLPTAQFGAMVARGRAVPIMAHEGEWIGTPARLAAAGIGREQAPIRNYTFNIQAMDAQSFRDYMENNRDEMVSIMTGAIDDNHPARRTG
ncbi:MAG: hypothetical protein DDT42_00438 [candidate division WS2 bacterium]|uniref:Tail tape measure protein n=1 Tax=Psychracetigena formicireducens TaxID=2986056 RepID=A0A9E2F435_PSYF1|nr:hypothetical protein [Candidatus Psychracetigena formicireducens]